MALVSARRSTLNPHAPLFIPAALLQIEDFSPEWWELVTTSTWFNDYWLSQHQGEGNFGLHDEDDFDVSNLLPDSFDTSADEDLADMEAQFEEFIHFSEREGNEYPCVASRGMPKNGSDVSAAALMQNMNLSGGRGFKYATTPARYQEKPAKKTSPNFNNCSPRCIQQPR